MRLMKPTAMQLPEDVPALRELVPSLQARVGLQEELIRLLRIDKYGAKSERLNDRQLELLEGEPGVQAGEIRRLTVSGVRRCRRRW